MPPPPLVVPMVFVSTNLTVGYQKYIDSLIRNPHEEAATSCSILFFTNAGRAEYTIDRPLEYTLSRNRKEVLVAIPPEIFSVRSKSTLKIGKVSSPQKLYAIQPADPGIPDIQIGINYKEGRKSFNYDGLAANFANGLSRSSEFIINCSYQKISIKFFMRFDSRTGHRYLRGFSILEQK